MKVAVISDIHGNMQALESVLADIEIEKCDQIFCLGDIAMAGPEPIEVTELIKKMSDNDEIIVIQGNTDAFIGNFDKPLEDTVKAAFPIMGNALEDDVKIMPAELREFLKQLPKMAEICIEKKKILLVHGSPRKNDENIMPDLPLKDVEKMIESTDADLIFCGHTHIPCGYQTNTKQTVVNVGSIGRPFTTKPQSCYAIVEFTDGAFNVMHKFVSYDNEKAASILAKRAFTGADKLSPILLNPEHRHM